MTLKIWGHETLEVHCVQSRDWPRKWWKLLSNFSAHPSSLRAWWNVISSGRVVMMNTPAQWKLLHTWIILAIVKEYLVQIGRTDRPNDHLSWILAAIRSTWLPVPPEHDSGHGGLQPSFQKVNLPRENWLSGRFCYNVGHVPRWFPGWRKVRSPPSEDTTPRKQSINTLPARIFHR